MPSFFADKITGKNAFIINSEEIKHLKVKRIKIGEAVRLIDGKGFLYFVTYKGFEGKEAVFLINKIEKIPYFVPFTFYIGFTDPGKMELIAEKAGEMGVKAFGFFKGDKTEKHAKSPNEDKIRKKIISGMKQSDNPNMPMYLGIMESIDEIGLSSDSLVFLPDVDDEIQDIVSKDNIKNVIVGPREGFSERELGLLERKNTLSATLGDTTYRVETAFIISSFLLKK